MSLSSTNSKPTILIVDDMDINRMILREILNDDYIIEEAEDGEKALELMNQKSSEIDLVLLDVIMPKLDGMELLKLMKESKELQDIPVIIISSSGKEQEGLNAGAIDFVFKPFEPDIIKLRVRNQIDLLHYRKKLEAMVQTKVDELLMAKETFLETMAEMIEYRSLESGEHIQRTKQLSEILISELLKDEKYRNTLIELNHRSMVKAVPLHDVGKIGIPDAVLLKPGKLTPEEFEIIKTHTTIGCEMIQSMVHGNDYDYFKHAYDIARSHHERFDGSGYPDKLKGEDIPLAARIVSIVDVYDALVSERCYKKAFPKEKALEIIQEGAGTQFDPELTEAFMRAKDRF